MSERTHDAAKVLRLLLPVLAVPALIALGMIFLPAKYHLVVSLLVALLALLLFYVSFEKSSRRSGRVVIAAVMIALSVAGRFIPLFKPVAALAILSGVYLGGETGFLTGSLSALLSDFYFGQGPWTPFQMLAWGMIGLAAGLLSKPLKKSRIVMILYALLSGVFYSLVMDVWTVLSYSGSFEIGLYLAAILSALPFTAVYAVSNVVYLLLLAKPFGRKLERAIVRYRL